jgi:toxin FitB
VFEQVLNGIEHRILSFDTNAAEQTAALMAARRRTGRTGELRDAMIAGIAIARHATLATRNTRHFADLPLTVVDPWTA